MRIKEVAEGIAGVLGVLVIVLLVVAIISTPIVLLQTYFNRRTCNRMQRLNQELKFDFSFWGGCVVETPKRNWIPISKMYLIEEWK